MRRWRVVVMDDNPEGSLEAVLLSPLVLGQTLPRDASRGEITEALKANALNTYLPLQPGELYANEADVDFQTRDFASRRIDCYPRLPMVEVERDFVRAWKLVGELSEKPPDILFLDVMFEQKTSAARDIEAIIREIQGVDRIGQGPRPTIMEILSRGGLFLLGRLLRNRSVPHMPMIVLYTASRDVQSDFRPFEYASNGRFEVVEKSLLRKSAERRNQVFRRRIRDYFMDGTVRPDEVRAAVTLLSTREAIEGDHETLVRAFSHPIGSDWCFGAMFAAESVAYLSRDPSRRSSVVDDLEDFIAPMVSDARSFVDLMERSPARLFSHRTKITFSHRPSWLDPAFGDEVKGNSHVSVSLLDLERDLSEVQGALETAVGRLPASLREVLGAALDTAVRPITAGGDGLEARRRRVPTLDGFVRSLSGYNVRWEALLDQCRMTMPAVDISSFLAGEVANPLHLHRVGDDITSTNWDLKHKLELFLAPSESSVKEPLAGLLRAIVNGIRRYACPNGGQVLVEFSAHPSPTTLELVIRDDGTGFADLQYYDPLGRAGDLSTALLAAADWFEVEVHSRGIRCRPTARRAGTPEPSDVTRGTSFVIRIPAFRLEV